MKFARLFFGLSMLLFSFSSPAAARAQQLSLETVLDQFVGDDDLVAAQAVVGRGEGILVDHAVGVTMPGGDQRIDASTLFCIGSCSKPFASAVVMTLIEDGTLDLEQPIHTYIPAFGELKLIDGEPSPRAPTMKELLAHRSGIYSQKLGMTPRQQRWIRDFGLTLEQSVEGIADEPLIAQPGAMFAYSGAGYCVAGRVAEAASESSFEELLQDRIAEALELTRTTYFPDTNDHNVAAGGSDATADPTTPHLTKPELRFPLIGGSLYSTARETASFLDMVAQRGRLSNVDVMTPDTWCTWTSRPYSDGTYGYGWSVPPTSTGQPTDLSHTGALAHSRSSVKLDLETGAYAVVHYTVAGNGQSVQQQIHQAMTRAMRQLP